MEDKLCSFLSQLFRCIKVLFSRSKDVIYFLMSLSVVLLIVGFLAIMCFHSAFSPNSMQAIAEWGTLIVAFASAIYAIKQYKDRLKEERRKLLCEYNQRYSSDKNIEAVIEWMLLIAKTDDNGDITGANNNINTSPGTHKKEMFMRFFEELNLRLDKGDMNAEEIYNLFAYYALKFDKYKDFRLDIKDYYNKNELSNLYKDNNISFKDNWSGFRSFIEKMEKVESDNSNNQLNK